MGLYLIMGFILGYIIYQILWKTHNVSFFDMTFWLQSWSVVFSKSIQYNNPAEHLTPAGVQGGGGSLGSIVCSIMWGCQQLLLLPINTIHPRSLQMCTPHRGSSAPTKSSHYNCSPAIQYTPLCIKTHACVSLISFTIRKMFTFTLM